MKLDHKQCYQALLSKDRKFDGRLFVGVSSTGIYCRPICTVRPPKPENCTFYPSAAAAEQAGFRPCLRCRPELAPGFSSLEAGDQYIQAAIRLIECEFMSNHNCAQLAEKLGITDRHLRRIFAEQLGVSPLTYYRSYRLLQAKRLLTDTDLPVSDVALIAEFGSLRHFNEEFRSAYHLTPNQLRRQPVKNDEALHFRLTYRPPYDWAWMLSYLKKSCVSGMEEIEQNTYRRTLSICHDYFVIDGWFSVSPCPNSAEVKVAMAPTLMKVVPQVLWKIRHLFDLDAQPEIINQQLGSLATTFPGTRLPGCIDPFEFIIRAILEQQVTAVAAATITGRLVQRFGRPILSPYPSLTHVFPIPDILVRQTENELCPLGLTRRRAQAIQRLAEHVLSGNLLMNDITDIERSMSVLTTLPGIGEWTASYIAMRAWQWPDAFLPTDYIVRQRFPGKTSRFIADYAERWRPWRSYAVYHLWRGVTPEEDN